MLGGDSLITILTVILAAILLFVFPMITLADRTDDISQLAVQTATVEFVDEVRKTGKIIPQKYDEFVQTINSTGNTYKVDMELKSLDENPSKKNSTSNNQVIGENVYYSVYTAQLEEQLEKGTIYLKQGDIFSVSVSNINQTISEVLKNFFYKMTGNSSYTITGEHAGIIMVNGQ